MKSLCWNVLGLGSPRAVRRLCFLVKQHNPHLLFLMETKLDKKRMEKVRRKCGFVHGIEVEAEGSRGGLCMAWKNDISVSLRSFSRWHIDVLIEDNLEEEWRYTGFYGFPYLKDKNPVWNLLRRLAKESDLHWLVEGDFNEILYSFEKCGGIPRDEKRMEAFRETLVDCQLFDIGFSGVRFTWERGNLPETNIRERLDRGLQMKNVEYSSAPSLFYFRSLSPSFEYKKVESFHKDQKIPFRSLVDHGRISRNNTKIHLNLEIDKDEMYWEQRVRQNWL
ncbi:reverse transcriptase [Gossypium australe]|uniref:Reverse transcriptase n=1 Tax=Gossypium australe TaxID=47621 RepID=A0A5B6VK35_9ROSI|nr:reverse transcriptase [Gossypium australe]